MVKNQHKEPKTKKINGEWRKLEEEEWWITEYKVC